MMNMTTKQTEYLAKLKLEAVCNYPKGRLQLLDKPDLQDYVSSYGIEVVNDCYREEKQGEVFVRSVFNKPYSIVSTDEVARFEKLGGKLKIENGIVNGASFASTSNTIKHIVGVIRQKTEKLNSGNYAVFQKYGLYVFVDTVSLYDSYVASIIQEASEIKLPKSYCYLYLDQLYEMVICNMNTQSYERVPIPWQYIRNLFEEGLKNGSIDSR